MIRFIFRNTRHQKLSILLFLAALLVIQLALPISITSVNNTLTDVQTNIAEKSRGSYDILVRPKGSRNNVEKQLRVVAENYLDGAEGGITIDEWKKISEHPDIEIAAPVATIGYFTGINRSFNLKMPDQSTRVTAQFYTSDGLEKYSIEGIHEEVMIEQEPLRWNQDGFARIANSVAFNAFIYRVPPTFHLPRTYHFLVGIDTGSEEQLTGIDMESIENFDYAYWEEEYKDVFPDVPIFPVMKMTDLKVPLSMEATVESLHFTKEQTKALREKYDMDPTKPLGWGWGEDDERYAEVFDYLMSYPSEYSEDVHIDFSEGLVPFKYDPLRVNEQGKLTENKEYMVYQDKGATSKYYITTPIQHDILTDGTLRANRIGTKNGVPIFRNVYEKGKTRMETEDVPFLLHPEGEFQVGDKTNQLASSPLGIYQMEPVKTLKDDQVIHPTIYPGSFVSSSAQGLTTLETAREIKGKAPIDAIRIRVAGIGDYTESAAEEIEEIAGEFAEDGYEVDVVAGASHQQIEVDVPGIGTVLEPWTTLGAAAKIVDGWNLTSIIITIAFVFVSAIYLFNRLKYWKTEKAEEIKLLNQLGWKKKHVVKKFCIELFFVILTSYMLSLAGIWAMKDALDLQGNVYQLQIGAVFLLIVFMVLLSLFPSSKSKQLKKDRLTLKKTNVFAFARRNLAFYRSFIWPPFVQLIIVSTLALFVFLSLQETIRKTNLTVLGKYINADTSFYHELIMVAALTIAMVTTVESLLSLLENRKKEFAILKQIGWTRRYIQLMILTETCFWTGLAILTGMVIVTGLYALVFGLSISSLLTILGLSLGFFVFIVLVSSVTARLHRSLKL